MELDHVQIVAPPGCEPAARHFFGELLGLEEIAKPTALAGRGGVWFALEHGRQLHVGVVSAAEFTPAPKAHPAFRVSAAELTRLAVTLEAAGLSVDWPEPGDIPGITRFHTSGPVGQPPGVACR